MDLRAFDVHDLATGGDGIGRLEDGRVVFVPDTAPGDRISAVLTEDGPRMARARLVEVLAASPDRVAPPCPAVARGCGGCDWQHLDVDAQRRGKVRLLEESLRRIGRVPGTVDAPRVLATEGFRTSVRALVGADGRLGLRARASHDHVPLDGCLVAHPRLGELFALLRLPGVGEVTLRVSESTGVRYAVIDEPALAAAPGAQVPADLVVVDPDGVDADGELHHLHEVVCGHDFRVSMGSFFQTRTDGAAALVEEVRAAGKGCWGSGHLVDLYGGVGLFAATLGAGMAVTLVEGSRSSIADAIHNLDGRDAEIVRCSVERWRPRSADVVVADPPRAGLGRPVVERITATGARRLVTVHCDAAAFGRDAGLLDGMGWTRMRSVPVDLFPHTSHVEVVTRWDRQ